MIIFSRYDLNSVFTLTKKYLIRKNDIIAQKVLLSDLKRVLKDGTSQITASVNGTKSKKRPYKTSYNVDTGGALSSGSIGCCSFDKTNWGKIVDAADGAKIIPKKRVQQ